MISSKGWTPLSVLSYYQTYERCKKLRLNVTYCTNRKRNDAGLLPARERYLSSRIDFALKNFDNTWIFSGKYGLIHPDTPIEDYDHLFQVEEVPMMLPKLVEQLPADVDEIMFLEQNLTQPQYRVVIQRLADTVGIKFQSIELTM